MRKAKWIKRICTACPSEWSGELHSFEFNSFRNPIQLIAMRDSISGNESFNSDGVSNNNFFYAYYRRGEFYLNIGISEDDAISGFTIVHFIDESFEGSGGEMTNDKMMDITKFVIDWSECEEK